MSDGKCMQATPHGTLLEQIMDSTQAKNEREWAAMREIESLRQWKREAIEVLDEWDETWIAADKPGSLGKSKAQGVKELVESLRQRVKELEARCIQHAGEKEKLKAELAALKADDNLTVAYMSGFHDGKKTALKAGRNALAEFNEHWQEDDGNDPIERLRFFCSLAMRGQDWLDVEPFFDALKQGQGEPVAYGLVMPSGQIDFDLIGTLEDCKFWSRAESERQSGWKIAALYTAPTIPEGENEAVRMFLMYYGANGGITVNAMRENLFLAGFDGYWPGWVEEAENLEHLTKAGAQSWLRYLFIAAAPKPEL